MYLERVLICQEDGLLIIDGIVYIVELHIEEFVRRSEHIRSINRGNSTSWYGIIGLCELIVIEVIECNVVPDHATTRIVRLDAENTHRKTAGVWYESAASFFVVCTRVAEIVGLAYNECALDHVDTGAVDTDHIICNFCVVNDEVVAATPDTMFNALRKKIFLMRMRIRLKI